MPVFMDENLCICASLIKYGLLLFCQSQKAGVIQILLSVQNNWLVTFGNDDDGYVGITRIKIHGLDNVNDFTTTLREW